MQRINKKLNLAEMQFQLKLLVTGKTQVNYYFFCPQRITLYNSANWDMSSLLGGFEKVMIVLNNSY